MNRKQILASVKSVDSSPGSLCTFTCTATTSQRDRDGDILKSGGAVLDSRAPLLFNHDPSCPIGKVLGKTAHTADRLDVKCSITDFGTSSGPLAALARDCATLVKAGALAVSIGFEPSDYSPSDVDGERYII